jgi:hypothetical protein
LIASKSAVISRGKFFNIPCADLDFNQFMNIVCCMDCSTCGEIVIPKSIHHLIMGKLALVEHPLANEVIVGLRGGLKKIDR